MRGCTCHSSVLCPWCQTLADRAGEVLPQPTRLVGGLLRAAQVEGVTEKVFMAAVVRLAREAGYLTYHTWSAKRSPAGFPDLVIVHPTRHEMPVFMVEVKTATGQVTPAQQAWVDALDGRSTVSAIWRPEDLSMIRRWLC